MALPLVVLNVAYPFAPVGPHAVGGAEQVLSALDRMLVSRGHRSWVLACTGSRAAGKLCTSAAPAGALNAAATRAVREAHRALIEACGRDSRADVVHVHGVDFDEYLPAAGLPVLVTLHLPLSFYAREALFPRRPDVHLCCVSESQRLGAPPGVQFGPDLPNGVSIEALRPVSARSDHLVMLSRICPEKGVHLALELAHRLDRTLLIAGELFRYPEHMRYFEEEVRPRLDAKRRFLGPVDLPGKRELLGRAGCLLVPSLVDETSSLVSMEALACGTPVVAFRRGALPETIEHGKTGFIVDTADEMRDAVRQVGSLRPADCRRAAETRFSEQAMGDRYIDVYAELAGRRRQRSCPPSASLDVEILTRTDELESLRGDWLELWNACPSATSFQRPEWLVPWRKHLLSGECRAVAVRRARKLVGFAPFFVWRDGGSRVLSLMGAGVSDYQDVLLLPGEPDAVALLAEVLVEECRRLQRVEWSELAPGSQIISVEESLGMKPRIEAQEPCPCVPLAGAEEDGGLAWSRLWSKSAYAERRAMREGLSLERATEHTFDEMLEAVIRLHRERHTPSGELARSYAERTCFLRATARELHGSHLLLLLGLRRNRASIVGALLGLRDRRAVRYYMSGFDPCVARYSPGTLLIGRALREASRIRADHFDFMRGAEPYKYRWGARDRIRLERHVLMCGRASEPQRAEPTDARRRL